MDTNENTETMTVTQQIEKICEEMCDHYCKYPNEPGHEDDWLMEEGSPCYTCPLMRLN